MHYRRTTTTTTVTEEISFSNLTKGQQALYEATRSPYGNPERELLRKIATVSYLFGVSEEEATRIVLHSTNPTNQQR